MEVKRLYIISGCNGAGKTTASFSVMPEILDCKEFVNADEIARGISPFQPETVAIEAGRIMLNRINDLLNAHETFAFETTLSSKVYVNLIHKARKNGYNIILIFIWLNNVELAKKRVAMRVAEGGHHVENEIIERRYLRGINNLFNLYLPIVDSIFFVDNSSKDYEIIAEKKVGEFLIIKNSVKFNLLESYYERN
ncbi:zeta toxin family protein [Sphingobacterium hungaricum]